jgi:ribosomal protein L37AE/L43A
VKGLSLTSRPDSLVCPLCEMGQLCSSSQDSIRCQSCQGLLSGALLETLRQISALPDALGSHACEECAHPEMRCLPDGILHCPGCGSEVLPTISKCPTRAVGTSRGHRQFDGGHLDTPSALKKSSQRRVMQAPEGGEP